MAFRNFKSLSSLPPHGGARLRGSGPAARDRGVTYTLRRLKRDRPDLLDRVAAGELSANAAAVAAGFRKVPGVAEECRTCGAGSVRPSSARI